MEQAEEIQLTNLNFILKSAVSIIGRTWRYRIIFESAPDAYTASPDAGSIFCTWHENILAVSYFFRNRNVGAMASFSKDGARISSILKHWKFHIIQGSFERGGYSAIRQSVRSLKEGRCIIITPDGPRGPRHVAKLGTAHIAQLASALVIPIQFIPLHTWRLTSWDRFMIPWPFTTITTIFKRPLQVEQIKETRENSIEILTKRIQATMEETEQKAQ